MYISHYKQKKIRKIVKQPNLYLIVVVIVDVYVCAIIFFIYFIAKCVRHGVEAKISTWNVCLYDFIMAHLCNNAALFHSVNGIAISILSAFHFDRVHFCSSLSLYFKCVCRIIITLTFISQQKQTKKKNFI